MTLPTTAEASLASVATTELISGGGELSALVRSKDWAQTPLGPIETWPQSLRTVVQIMLGSRYAMWMGWGDHLIFFYNDAYRPTLGIKHSWALGASARQVWREIWPDIGPRIDLVLQHGEATWDEGLLLFLERHGFPEETYHTFSYSPLRDDRGAVGGMLCVVTEETDRVIGERRLRVLRELAAGIATTRKPDELFDAIRTSLGAHRHDMPFTLTYAFEADGRYARLVSSSGVGKGDPIAAPMIDSSDTAAPWPIGALRATLTPTLIEDLANFPALPSGAWDIPPRQAIAFPLAQQGQTSPAGVFIAGINPYRPLDDEYRGFISLVAGQIASGIANARAYEAEHRRAEALAEIDRAKTAFFSNASHEFRTPLTLMLSPLEDLLVRNATADVVLSDRREIELIHRNGLRLLKLVNTLLDFSRIEAGRVQAAYEAVDLSAYTMELASTFRSAMERAGLRYVVDTASLPAPAYVDRDMWEKIVLNLISNAFKYTLEGEVTVMLRAATDGSAAQLTVSDTGVGVPAQEVPRLFERFHRVEGQRGRTQEGTGIGLALVQELAKLHGGSVTAASTLGRGTSFTVSIPLGKAHLPADRIGAARTAPSTGVRADAFVGEALRWLPGGDASEFTIDKELLGPGSAAGPEHSFVLLADDNVDMRDYVRRLLAPRYDVEAVADGQAALEAARKRRPDLVLTDVMMPRLDGFGLLRGLRGDADLRDVPVVLLSARAGEEAKVEGLEAGADDYLTKPFSARELLARVSTNLELARARRRAADILREETRRLETLNRTGAALAAELNLDRLVQMVTDAAVELTGAKFGAFFYNLINDQGESYTLYTLSGAPREAFEKFPMPRNTAVFDPTFRGEGVVRSDDILRDPRYGRNPPYNGMPKGHLPVRSYLACSVVSRSGEVHGGLFFGHPEPSMFSERDELIVAGIAAQAAIAIDNATLYRESRQAEEELRRLNETLEHRVAAEIKERMTAEEALRQAQKMEAIGRLTGGVAHDFNNLLQVILGNLDAMRRQVSDGAVRSEDIRRFTDAAVRGAERAAVLTQRLLAFSRRQPLQPQPLEVNKLVTGMSDLLRRTLGESITTETVLAGGLWRISADANQLESALLNLAVNARDAMRSGGKLTIETANTHLDEAYAAAHDEVKSGQYAMIAVTDTGIGMTKEVLAKAFDPFFTTKDVGQGTGLGLSQVYGFVKQSGGHVKIYSEPGEGTTVRLYLPRLPGGADDMAEAAPAQRVPSGRRSEIILVVEDDEDVRANTVEMLRELGYGVLEAAEGRAALRVLESNPGVHLLFTDVGLPGGLNGRQLADAALQRRPGLKLLFTTGYARNAIVHHGRLDPGLDLIVKPFTYTALAAKIRSVLESAV
ncbi:MAG TPA: ATP-binding protein [Stellaceae bacterium]|nr:ATP-binding protein [Stellaceae bacterium]